MIVTIFQKLNIKRYIQENRNTKNTVKESKLANTWLIIVFGLLMIVGALYYHHTYNILSRNSNYYVSKSFIMIANYGGKWPIPILLTSIGFFLIVKGIKNGSIKNEDD
jgi:H+/Cl- antiporter ClcA